MARHPKPRYRKDRKSWFVTINRLRHNLGPDKHEAFKQFYRLMEQPQTRKVSHESLVAIVDEFLEWNNKNSSIATYEAYRYRLSLLSTTLFISSIAEHRLCSLTRSHH